MCKDFFFQGYHLLIVPRSVIMVRPLRQGIGVVMCFRYMLELIVEVFQEINVSGHPPIDLLWMPVILQIGVICEHLYWVHHSCQQVSPVPEGGYNRQKFLVPDVVISLQHHQGF